MNVLEKILEEIGVSERIRFSKYTELLIAVKDVEKIIRSHMDEMPKCNNCSRREWYQIGYRDGRRINVENIKSINKEMGDYLFEKYCVEGFDEELDKIFNKYLVLGGDADVSSNYKSIEDVEIEPASEEFLKDCAETAARYKRNTDGWIPVEDGLPEEKGWYQCTCSDKDIWNEGIVRDLYYYLEIKEFVDNIRYENNGLKNIEKYYWTKYVTAWQPLPEPYRHKDIPTAKNTQQEMEDFWRDK